MKKNIFLAIFLALLLAACASEPKTEEEYLKNTAALYKTGSKCFIIQLDRWLGMWQYKDPRAESLKMQAKWKKLNCDLAIKAGEKLLKLKEEKFAKNPKKASKLRKKCEEKNASFTPNDIKDSKIADQKWYLNFKKAILDDPEEMLDCVAVGTKFIE